MLSSVGSSVDTQGLPCCINGYVYFTPIRHKGPEIAKPITPLSESASEEEDSDHEQAQKDKDMQKNLALIAKYFKKIYKSTNNNLRTSSNTKNKNVDTIPRYKNDNKTGQFGNQRTMTVAGARETECRKPKRVKDSTYHKEKMLLCKQAEKGVPLQAEQSDWLADTDEEIDEQELEAHYSYMAKIQEVPTADSSTDSDPLEQVQYDTGYNVFANEIQHSEQSESISNTCVVETGDSNVIPDSPNMCDNDIQNDQNAVECDDERVALANLIANLKLDVDENKKIQKQLKKANASLTQELTECKFILVETSRTLGESNSIQDSCLVALQNKQTEFERYKKLNDRTVDYDKLEQKLNETLGLLAQKDIEIKEGLKLKAYEISVVKEKHDELVKQSLLTKSHYEGLVKDKTKVITDLKLKEEKDIDKMISMEKQLKFLNEIIYKRSQSIQTIHMLALKCPTFNGRPTFANPMYLKKAQNKKLCLYEIPHDQSDPANRLIPDREEILTLEEESRSKLNKDLTCLMPLALKTKNDSFTFVHELKQEMHADLKKIWCVETTFDKPSIVRQPNAQRIPKPSVLGKPALFSDSLERKNFAKKKSVPKTNESEDLSKPVTTQNLPQTARKAISNTNVIKPGMYRIDTRTTQTRVPQLPQTSKNTNPRVSTSTEVNHITKVSRPQLRSTQMKDKVVPNTSQVKFKKTEVEDHHRISSNSNQTKSVTACNDSLKSRTLNVNVVCATCGKYVFNSNHDACVYKFLNDVNARTKKPKGNDLLTGNRGSDLYTISLQETTSSTLIYLMAKASPTQAWLWHRRLSHINFDYINLLSKKDVVIGLPKLKYVKDQLCSSYEVSKAKRISFKTKAVLNDYSRYTWTLFLRFKDETPEVLKDFLTMIQRNLQALVISVRTDKGTKFLNKTLNSFFKEEGIEHQTSTPQTPKQNGIVERRNRTLVEAA
ncbi:retrovirus-related pol polyprotein from transposon TNT 1-94 [Tanacetum coccineum]